MLKHYISRALKLSKNLTIRKTFILIWEASKNWTILSVLIILLEIGLLFYSLILFKNLVNVVASIHKSQQTLNTLNYPILITAAIASLYIIVTATSTYIKEIQSSKVSVFVDDKIHECAVNADLAFFESSKYLDVLRRAKDAGTDRPGSIVNNMMEIVKNLLTLGGILYILISISIYLLPLIILFTLPTLILKIKFSEKVLKWRLQQTVKERKIGYLSDLITSDGYAKEVKSYSLGNLFREMYLNLRNTFLIEKFALTRKNTLFEVISMIMAVLCFFACIYYIVLRTLKGQSSVGDITIFLFVFSQSFSVTNNLTQSIARVYENNIYLASIFELFEIKTSIVQPNKPKEISKNLDLDINGLCFSYPATEKPTLKDISLKIPAGKIIALVGENGSGKSTISKLLNRLYDPTQGEIKLGNINIKDFSLMEYRKYVAQVFQDFGKYNFSIADNIHFGKISDPKNESKIKLAAEKADATSFIELFDEEFETKMGKIFEEGHEISTGQWQKLAIARAFYSDADFLIFDEATSALDAIAEDKLFTNLRSYLGKKAALIISHRVSAIKHADYIYVIDAGKIVQEGKHETLINIAGKYAELFSEKKIVF